MMQPSKTPTVTGEWECTECGYIVEGSQARRPTKCPECEAPTEALEFFEYEDDDWEDEDEDELDLFGGVDDGDAGDDDLDLEEAEEFEDEEDAF